MATIYEKFTEHSRYFMKSGDDIPLKEYVYRRGDTSVERVVEGVGMYIAGGDTPAMKSMFRYSPLCRQ